MKKFSIVVLLAVVAFSFIFRGNDFRPDEKFQSVVPASSGTKDDPQARLRFDHERFKDPVSQKIPDNIRRQELRFARKLLAKQHATGQAQTQGLLAWSQRGPYNIGGRTRALAIDVNDENVILAGGVAGGVWRSTDGGSSWLRTSDFNDFPGVTSIVQDKRPGRTNIWYYGTGEFRGSTQFDSAPLTGDGVYKSIDGGQSWSPLLSTISDTPQSVDQPFDYIWNVATDASNETQDEVYVAGIGSIQRSTDGGESWSLTLGSASTRFGPAFTEIEVTSAGVAYAALASVGRDLSVPYDSSGIFRSENGVDWTNITPDGWPSTTWRTVVGAAPSNERIVYFLSHTPFDGDLRHQLWKYTYVSGDGSGSGGRWDDLTANLPAFGGEIGDFSSQSSYDMTIAIKPDDATMVFVGGVNLYRSSSGFSTTASTRWIGGYVSANSFVQYAGHHPDQHNLAFSPANPNVLFSSHDGGVSMTRNGAETRPLWRDLSNGYFTTQFYAAALDQTPGSDFIVGGMQDNGTWGVNVNDGTANWREYSSGDGGFCAITDSGTVAITSSQNGRVFRYNLDAPGGRTGRWTRVDPEGASGYLFISPFIVDPNDEDLMYLPAGVVMWRNSGLSEIPAFSNNPATVNWEQLTKSRVTSGRISTLAASTQPANILYFATSSGRLYKMLDAHEGQPERVDLTDFSVFPRNSNINSIAVDPENGDRVLVAFSNYRVKSIFYSEDGGESWADVSGNLEEEPSGQGAGPSVRSVAILPGVKKMFFAGTSTGLYSTQALDGESTIWTQEGPESIGNAIVEMVVTRPADGEVLVATHGNGVFTTNLITSVSAEVAEPPRDFSLLQNYPNPFNPETIIPFSLPVAAHVKISVYDIAGRLVRTLADGVVQAGRHERMWDGRNESGEAAASGAYFVRLIAEKNVSTRKILLVR